MSALLYVLDMARKLEAASMDTLSMTRYRGLASDLLRAPAPLVLLQRPRLPKRLDRWCSHSLALLVFVLACGFLDASTEWEKRLRSAL